MARTDVKTKVKPTPWLPQLYQGATVRERAIVYMALNPSRYFTPYQLTRAVSEAWPAIEKYCQRLVAVGLVQLKVCYLRPGKRRYDTAPVLMASDVPEHLSDLPDNQPIIAYAASPMLVERVKSGAFLKMIEREKRKPTPINGRIIRVLAERHLKDVTVGRLQELAEVSESRPDLARRLEHLVAADWVVLTEQKIPGWAGPNDEADRYYLAADWKVRLSAGGWLRIQRAKRDGVEPAIPKPRKKAKKEKPVAV